MLFHRFRRHLCRRGPLQGTNQIAQLLQCIGQIQLLVARLVVANDEIAVFGDLALVLCKKIV